MLGRDRDTEPWWCGRTIGWLRRDPLVADSSRTITGANLRDPLDRLAALHKDLPAHPLWGNRYAERMLDELTVTADPAKPPSEPRWRCPIPDCGLEVIYPEELEFHADVVHPCWEVCRVAVRGFRHDELQVVYRLKDRSAPEPADDEDDPECE